MERRRDGQPQRRARGRRAGRGLKERVAERSQSYTAWRIHYEVLTIPIAELRYSRKGATSKAWARSESTNDGRARQPMEACCRRSGSWRPKGEHYEVRRGHAMQVAADGGAQHQMQSKPDVESRREPDAPCRDEKIVAVASLLRSRSACNTTYAESVTCTALPALQLQP